MNKITEQIKDYRKLSLPALDAKLREAKFHYQDLAGQLAMGKIKTISKVKAAKKEVARLSTIRGEKAMFTEVTNG